jgi:hypothetical protein
VNTRCIRIKKNRGVSQRSENFRYFLSGRLPGVVEGERYKGTPEIVDEVTRNHVCLPAVDHYYLFRRWDMLAAADNPDVVIFFALPVFRTA